MIYSFHNGKRGKLLHRCTFCHHAQKANPYSLIIILDSSRSGSPLAFCLSRRIFRLKAYFPSHFSLLDIIRRPAIYFDVMGSIDSELKGDRNLAEEKRNFYRFGDLVLSEDCLGDMMGSRSKLKTTQERSWLMAQVRQSGTSVELTVRKLVRSSGFRFSVRTNGLPGRPDLVNRSDKWAIFVHGCFWHAHQGCPRWKIPANNRPYWQEKFRDNQKRDNRKVEELKELGYSVLIVWECELQSEAKVRKKIHTFMKRIYNTRADKGDTKMQLVHPMDSKLPTDKRESFRYTTSKKYLVRTVMLDGDRTFTTRLYARDVEPPCCDPRSAFDQVFLWMARRIAGADSLPSIYGVDLFCGCGGLTLGASEACMAIGHRFEPLLAVDIGPSCLKVYKENFVPKHIHEGDIWDIVNGKRGAPLTSEERALLKDLEQVDILLAGPPCQGHSDLNNHTRRKDRRNKLYERVGRFAEIATPKHILIENVPTIVHSRQRALDDTIKLLVKLGYRVDTGVVDMSRLGVPQRRKRHVVVASLCKSISIEDVVSKHQVSMVRDVEWAIRDLEREEANGIFTEPAEHSSANLKRINYLLEHKLYDLPNRLRPPCHQDGHHSYKSMYGRLKYDEPAQTITSGFGSPGQGRFVHPSQPRTLTPHEAARLQFFPDFFDFSSVKMRTALADMIGNAVPMKMSYVFCLEFII
jgi:DNA (cytosine-5)-methyltransferase 1